MTYYATSLCVGEVNQMCVDICPVQCVHTEDGLDRMVFIDPDACIDCGVCVPACPVSAIYAANELPEDQAVFAEIAALYFKDKDAARAMVPA